MVMIQRDGRYRDDEITRPIRTESGEVRAEVPRSGPVPTATTTASKPAAPRVLVIDDTELSRLAVVEVLAMAGYQVMQLASAIGATRVILQHKVQAAIVDVAMPGLSGDKLITLLRDNPRLQGLKIIVMSARSQVELEAIRAATGADAALDKSQLATELEPLLERLLGRAVAQPGR
jgi:CheY-like chemotaxis protein